MSAPTTRRHRRLAVWLGSTAAGTLLLFLYPSSTAGLARPRSAPLAPVGLVAAGPAPAPLPASHRALPAPVRSSAAPPRPGRSAAPAAGPSAPVRRAVAVRTAAPARSAEPTTPPTKTVNGAPAYTRYGPVQVQIEVRGHRIVRADAIVYPQDTSRDQEINSQAIPQLDQETLQAQSAQIDTVSGATYTSDGYRQSLQSALDALHS